MSKTNTIIRILAILLALAGLLLVWQSTIWGLEAVPGIVQHFGTISGDIERQIVYEGPVIAFRIIGAILLGIGLFRALAPFGKT
jgi:hypothetical protein